jgi:hypothetical protein
VRGALFLILAVQWPSSPEGLWNSQGENPGGGVKQDTIAPFDETRFAKRTARKRKEKHE